MSNNIETLKTLISEYSNKKIISSTRPVISIRNEKSLFIPYENWSDKSEIAEVEIESGKIISGNPQKEYKLHLAIYRKRETENSILHSILPATVTCAKAGKTIYPMLDDMAQIVGPTAKVSSYDSVNPESCSGKIIRKIKGRQAVLTANEGAICCGGTADDAQVAAVVLEKGCKAAIESSFLGGGVKISALECRLMHFVYMMKYSKQNEKNK